MKPRAWRWYLTPAIVIAIVYGLLPVVLWKEPIYDGLVTSAVIGILVGIRRHRPARPNQWNLLLIAMCSICAAEWVWFANDVRGINPFPSWGEYLDLAGRLVLLVALARLSSRRGQLRDRTAVIDAAAVGVAAAAVAWVFIFRTYFHRGDLQIVERLVTLSYLMLDISLFIGFVVLLFGARRHAPALRLLATGVGVLVAGDFVWLGLVAHNGYVVGHLLDAVWPIAYCSIAAAALHPTMTILDDSDAPARAPRRLPAVMLLVALVAIPASTLVIEIYGIRLSLLDGLVLSIGALLTGVATATRFLGLARLVNDVADARGARRTEALVRESLDVIAIVGCDQRVSYVSPPLERVLGWTPDEAIGQRIEMFASPEDRAVVAEQFAELIAGEFGTPYTFEMRVPSRTAAPVLLEVVCVNRLDDTEINGVIVSARDVSERHRLEREVEYQAFHDRLTGLANRSLLLDHIGLAIAQRRDEGRAVFVIDLDDFKSINDGLGHVMGDELLSAVGERLRSCVRPGDTVARLGGDQFGLLMSDADPDAVNSYARRLLEVLRLPLRAGPHELAIGASIGVRILGHDDTAQLTLRDANIAMYSAKRAGKGRSEIYDREMGKQAARRVALMADLRQAWQRGEISVHYQPIVEIPTGKLRGAEALVRWTHPLFGSVSPMEFVALAEETGIVRELGLEVLREAARNTARWRAESVPNFYVSVNVSPVQLDETFPHAVDEILASVGLDPAALLLEITESVVLSNIDASTRILEALRERGIRTAIDDFGTGYSSLVYAQQLPIDLVKIDRSFTSDLSATNAGMIPAIMQLAGTLSAVVVAEGVETREQMLELERLGCSLVQGHLFSPAVSAESLGRIAKQGDVAPGGAHAVRSGPEVFSRLNRLQP